MQPVAWKGCAVNEKTSGGIKMTGLKSATSPLAVSMAALLSTLPVAGVAETITIWGGYPEMVPFYERVAESMKGEFPDLEVKIESISVREHEKRIALGLTSGAGGVKVIEMATSTASRYIENDLLQVAPDETTAFVTGDGNFDMFFQKAASGGGAVYGVPLFKGQGALFYNTAMFEEAGLPGAPTSMEEFSAYANTLTQRDDNATPTVSGWSMRLSGGGQGIAEKFWINLFQYGGNVLIEDSEGAWRADYANDAGLKALGQYLNMLYGAKTVTIEMPADADAFERGQTAMFIRESWVIGDIASKAPDLPYATATLPVGTIALPVNLYVSDGDDADVKAAWAFAEAANDPDNLNWMLDNVGWLPIRANVDYSAVVSNKPALDAFVNAPEGYQFFTLPAIGPIEEVLTRLAAQLTAAYGNPALLGDDAAIMKVLETAAAETNAILDRAGILAK